MQHLTTHSAQKQTIAGRACPCNTIVQITLYIYYTKPLP